MTQEKPISIDDAELELADNVTPIKRLEPGDILDVVVKLRQLSASYETAAYTLYASFSGLGGPALDAEAQKARHTLELASTRLYALLTSLEKTEAYQTMRNETLARRKERYAQPKGKKS